MGLYCIWGERVLYADVPDKAIVKAGKVWGG